MKRMMLLLLICCAAGGTAEAQSGGKAGKNTPKTVARAKAKPARPVASGPVIRLTSVDSAQARSGRDRLRIAGPTIRAMNDPALDNGILGPVGIPGMPKRAYGFANGRLLLRPTGATTSGTALGSGTVGTGSSLGPAGTSGRFMGVNGKSPYAGNAMWGNARNLIVTRGDSAVRAPVARDRYQN